MHSQKSSSSSLSSNLSHELGDFIGMESCVDLISSELVDDINAVVPSQVCGGGGGSVQRWGRRREKRENQYPPPMPSLARTGNLHSHMPWAMKKCYTDDGRLVIVEEKVKHHEYFMTHRSNGRLILHLVPLEYDDVLNTTHDPNTVFEGDDDEEKINHDNDNDNIDGEEGGGGGGDDEKSGGAEGKNGRNEAIAVDEKKLMLGSDEAESSENKEVSIMKGGGEDSQYYQCSGVKSEKALNEPEESIMWKLCKLIQI